MLKMAQMEYIRFLRETKKLSLSEIVRTTKTTWRTAKKYADGQGKTQKGPRQRRRARVLKDAYREALETWILEDERRPRKHRRTAQALYNQLVEEKGYRGSSRTVRDCVKEMRAQLVREETTHLSLDHRPGVAQVDFGVTLTVIAGEEAHERVVYKLVMTFPYSNDALTRHLPAENTECLLEGLRSMFEELGGVPRDIWFDNLSAAVKDVLQGEQRTLNRLFSEFSWHYKFKSTFCNPGRAHEKGAVENKVGTLRRNCDSPPQRIEQLSELDERAAKERARRRGQRHYKKLTLISELFEEDRRSLLVLPEIPYTISSPDTAVVSKTGEVKIRKELYHIPGASIRQKVFARVFAYHIDFYDQYGEVLLSSQPRKYVFQGREIDWVKELECYANKPRAIEHATYLKNLPPQLRQYLLAPELPERRQRVNALIGLLKAHPLKHVEQSIATGLEVGRTDYESLKSLVLRIADAPTRPLLETYTPRAVVAMKPDLKLYSMLQEAVDHE